MKVLRGTVFGGIFYFLFGWLVYGVIFMDYFTAHINQCANKTDGSMIWWAIIASNLLAALFLTLFLKWSGTSTIKDALMKGALFGALFTAMIDLSFWSMTNMYDSLVTMLAETVLSAVVYALMGLVIVLTWGKEKVKS
jgi:hypothetical protein